MIDNKSEVISNAVNLILKNNKNEAKQIITRDYPHKYYEIEKRTYTLTQKMK